MTIREQITEVLKQELPEGANYKVSEGFHFISNTDCFEIELDFLGERKFNFYVTGNELLDFKFLLKDKINHAWRF